MSKEVIGLYTVTKLSPRHQGKTACQYCLCPPAEFKVTDGCGYKEYVCPTHLERLMPGMKRSELIAAALAERRGSGQGEVLIHG